MVVLKLELFTILQASSRKLKQKQKQKHNLPTNKEMKNKLCVCLSVSVWVYVYMYFKPHNDLTRKYIIIAILQELETW